LVIAREARVPQLRCLSLLYAAMRAPHPLWAEPGTRAKPPLATTSRSVRRFWLCATKSEQGWPVLFSIFLAVIVMLFVTTVLVVVSSTAALLGTSLSFVAHAFCELPLAISLLNLRWPFVIGPGGNQGYQDTLAAHEWRHIQDDAHNARRSLGQRICTKSCAEAKSDIEL